MSAAANTPLGSRLRAARAASGGSPHSTPASSPGGDDDPIIRMSSLRSRPTPISRSATSAEFHADSDVWVSTPVRASQREEFTDKLDFAFSYGEELSKLLCAHGFKPKIGITLDTPEAESDFAVLLANMSHVFGPVSRDEFLKLVDLDNEYEVYHLTLNELIYIVLPTVLRGTALTLYEESSLVHPHDGRCALQRLRYHVEGIGDPDPHRFWVRLRAVVIDETIEPAPQLAVFRMLADKHRKLNPSYADSDLVQDLYAVLRASAASSPHFAPLYLVVLRELGMGQHFTYSSLALRLSKVFRDEFPLARRSEPVSGGGGSAAGGGARGGGGGSPGGSAYSFGSRRREKPIGDWKPVKGVRYLQWEGRGSPCVTCFRLWAVTDAHLGTAGVCPYSCTKAFSPDRVPPDAPPPPSKPPPLSAWPPSAAPAARALQVEPAPQDDTAPQGPAVMHVRSIEPAPDSYEMDSGPVIGLDVGEAAWVPGAMALSGYIDEGDDTDWPAFRSGPVYIPPTDLGKSAVTDHGVAPPSGGAP
ncbi:hypothetical protein CYMTET_13699 [Cymbomonas tetramitiformis]|uniref:Uncharacterized protein n=1 Tax=Cymbomonas tetramitiformis TaxID=36881 RepID=A0AAE0LB57_9CHLO|nr:hypothetical protein CYMTET_13699 [Cymbomonas tetramitiformis]